jgi:ribulose-phosphate 3-epimerase
MNLSLGIKSDPVQYRYSYEWLFDLCAELNISFVQLGSFFELYQLDMDYFYRLGELAESRGVRLKSCFTAHRELGGFFTGDASWEKVARRNYERFIDVAAVLGADYVGSNPGAIYRDMPGSKAAGIECYIANMKELMHYAAEKGIKALTIEPMSCLAEPPSTPQEITGMMGELSSYHKLNKGTVPVYLCGDVSHGVADEHGRVVHEALDLFALEIPWMAEFHFKNTDARFNSTFGFSLAEQERGHIGLGAVASIIKQKRALWPVEDVVGYLEIGGPKLGRDYSDPLLRKALQDSIEALQGVFQTHGLVQSALADR